MFAQSLVAAAACWRSLALLKPDLKVYSTVDIGFGSF